MHRLQVFALSIASNVINFSNNLFIVLIEAPEIIGTYVKQIAQPTAAPTVSRFVGGGPGLSGK